jgi:hypothetical protein
VFGTPFNIFCNDNGEITKSDKECIEDGSIININSKDAWLMSKIYGFQIPRFPAKKYVNSIEAVLPENYTNTNTIQWASIMPDNVYKKEIKRFVNKTKDIFCNQDFRYYRETYQKQNILFKSLKPAKINTDLFLKHLNNNFGEGDSIKTFLPLNGYSEKPYYDRFGTITGRLKIAKGPNILNLKKEYRYIIESRFGTDGKIYYLDYSSLEPRAILTLNGKTNIPQDIYTHILKELNIVNKVPREAIKISALSKIYGSSNTTISKQLKGIVSYPEDIIKMIVEYFGIEQLSQTITEQYYKHNGDYIENYYSRHIRCEDTPAYKLLNYYIQSTSVDIAMLGFTNIVNRIIDANIVDKIVPIFILHDAIFFDIHNDYEYLVPKLCKAASTNIPGFEKENFYLKLENKWFIDRNNKVIIQK